MYAVTSMPLVSRTRATLRSAEFGFFGVVVYTRVHTPRRCGLPLSAGVLVLVVFAWRPLRTSWLIVGIRASSLPRPSPLVARQAEGGHVDLSWSSLLSRYGRRAVRPPRSGVSPVLRSGA